MIVCMPLQLNKPVHHSYFCPPAQRLVNDLRRDTQRDARKFETKWLLDILVN